MRTLSEATVFQSVIESAFMTPGTTLWRQHQPNDLQKFGAAFKKISRNPIGGNRQLQKGDVVDLEAATEWTCDLTKDLVDHFVEGIMLASSKQNGGSGTWQFRPTAYTATTITVPAGGALPQYTLIYGRGALQAANNGLRQVGAASTGVSIITTGGAVEAVSGYLATVEVAGYRASVAADIQMDASGNIIGTVANFTTMGLFVGQWIWVGGILGGSNAFANASYRGFAQIAAIATGKITLARRSWTVGAADTATGKSIDLYFGRWCRNTSAQSGDYKETSYTFETTYATLTAGGAAEYEYSEGNYLSQIVLNLPVTDKVTCDMTFIGATTIDPSTTRLTGASTADAPLATAMVNTSTNIGRVRISNTDESGLSTDIKSLKVTLANNVSRELVIATLGARFMNVGDFVATVEGELLFTSDLVVTAVRDNRTIMFECSLRNGDGGFLIDIPSLTLDMTDRKFTANMSVTVQAKATGFQDALYGYTCGITEFPFLPPV
jgi:hypothetical protein